MRDTTHMPLFPSATPQAPTTTPSGRKHQGARSLSSQHAQEAAIATVVRRLIAGAVFGLVMVGVLWYLMQFNQQTAALTATFTESSATAPSLQGVVLVTVKSGDSLWAIAAQHRPAWRGQEEWVRDVAAYNQIGTDTVFPGQVLAIPTY